MKEKNKRDILSYIRNGREVTTAQEMELVARLSIPAILAQITSVLMQYIDASMVGKLGAVQSASIGLVSTSTWLFGSVCMSITTGFSVQVAQNIGARRNDEAKSVLRQSLVCVLSLSLLMMLIGMSISGVLPAWLGGEKQLRGDAAKYFFIYAASLPVMGINTLAGSMLQCSGNMKIPSVLNSLMCLLDVVFNAFFIFPSHKYNLFGKRIYVPGMGLGVTGAAIGTLLSEVIILGFMLYFLCVRNEMLKIHLNESYRFQKNCIEKAFKISTPVAFEHIVVCGAMVVITRIVAPLGTISIAANSFAITAESLCYMPGYGIADAATTLIGQSIGAGRKKLVWRLAKITVWAGIIVMTITAVIMYLSAPQMLALLTPDKSVQNLGVAILRIEAFVEPMYAASIVVSGALRGAGDTFIPSIMNFVSLWIVRIPLSYLLAVKYGLKGVWIAMCTELCFRGIIFVIRLYRKRWIK